ncbi:MAG: aquaporin family protein [Gemmatimonadetes bacterium]|nr:aquaporin family protein [Gemmatimonadota bacterium]
MSHSALGEFLGTMILILLGDGVVAGVVLEKSKANNAGWIVITAGWAMAVLAGVFVASALGAPGELNPAATLANMLRGTRTTSDGLTNMAAQMAGAFAGATLVWLHYLPHWGETKDQAGKLACFCNAPAIRSTGANLLAEVIATFALIFILGMAFTTPAQGTAAASNLGPTFVGAVVWWIGLSLGGPTGYAINPARDLGPRIAHAVLPISGKGGSDWGYSWIPVVGPMVGGAVAALVLRSVLGG